MFDTIIKIATEMLTTAQNLLCPIFSLLCCMARAQLVSVVFVSVDLAKWQTNSESL